MREALPPSHTITPAGEREKLLVWLGPPFFSSQMPALGWEVVQCPHEPGFVRSWGDILTLTGGRVPEAVLVSDASIPPHVVGMEDFPCLTLLYVVDSHIHSWYPYYAQGFDACLVSLRDHVPMFTRGRLSSERVWWSPPYARTMDRPPAPELAPAKEWPLLFVGTVTLETTPERYDFMARLSALAPYLHVTRGYFGELYPKAEIVLNEAFRGDLNFRVFEALGCGACLMTPAVGHGLADIFTDKKDLFVYPPGDVAAVAELAQRLLAAPELRQAAAQSGLAAVDAAHRSSHRAQALSSRLKALLASDADDIVAARRREAVEIHSRYLRLLYLLHADTVDSPALRAAYLAAAKSSPSSGDTS